MDITDPIVLTSADIYSLSFRALRGCGVREENAEPVAVAIQAAELDGMHSHGLMRLPTYCRHALCGKVDGSAIPILKDCAPSCILVDAAHGFAHPAINLGLPLLIEKAKNQGIAMLGITRSYNAGAMGYHVERLAHHGIIALAAANAPASIAPWRGSRPVFGTNPIAFSAATRNGPALVVDQACSVVARGEIVRKGLAGEQLLPGWALDAQGRATTDPDAALNGSMLPFGGLKGVNIAWITEVLAACLTGATPSFKASSVINDVGDPPGIGQLFIAIAPNIFVNGFEERLEQLCQKVNADPPARPPGTGRWTAREKSQHNGVTISLQLYRDIQSFSNRNGRDLA